MTSVRRPRLMRKLTIGLISALSLSVCGVLAPPSRDLLSDGARADELRGTISYSPIIAGYQRFLSDFSYHYWDPRNNIPRLRPTEGYGYVNNNLKQYMYTYWEMAEAANILYREYKMFHAPAAKAIFQSQWKEVRSIYTADELSSADPLVNRHTISASDDAALALQYLVQVNEVTGDPLALSIAEKLLSNIRAFFRDPNNSGCGILYATPSEDPVHQKQSSIIEALTARSALVLYQKTGEERYRTYAEDVWNWIHACAVHPYGVFYVGADLDPGHPCYKHGVQCNEPGVITRGASVSYIGGTMGVASLSARLYLLTGTAKYLSDVNAILSAMLQKRTFLRPGSNVGLSGNVLLNDRDGWSDGIFAQNFAYDVLSLAGADPSGAFKKVFLNTAQSIINQRTPDGYYGADWSGPEWDHNHRWISWADQGLAPAAKLRAAISGTTMTVSSISSGRVTVGQMVKGAGVRPATQVVAVGSGAGGSGTYSVSVSQRAPRGSMTAGGTAQDYCCNSFCEANQIMTTANSGSIIQAAAMIVQQAQRR
jgi:Glycosyl hydrolase family 76